MRQFTVSLTTKPNGLSWPHARKTWQAGKNYFRGLLMPGEAKHIDAISTRKNIPHQRLQRFITDRPWQHDAGQTQLVDNVPTQSEADSASTAARSDTNRAVPGSCAGSPTRSSGPRRGKPSPHSTGLLRPFAPPRGVTGRKRWPRGPIEIPTSHASEPGERPIHVLLRLRHRPCREVRRDRQLPTSRSRSSRWRIRSGAVARWRRSRSR